MERVRQEGLGVSVKLSIGSSGGSFWTWMKAILVGKVNCCTLAVLGSAVATATLESVRHVYRCVLDVMESPLVCLQ